MPSFFTYIIQSEKSNRLYIGQTNDLDDRIKRHNQNRNKATAHRGPWNLIFFKEFSAREEAVQLEQKLKKMKNKQRILKWIENNG